MLTLKYPILHSGFLALSETGLTRFIPEAPTFSDTILFRQRNAEYDNLFYSEDVSKLFIRFQSNPRVIKDPEFQHEILAQAMKRFGPSIIDWIDFQSNKPAFTQTHKQFLIKMSAWMSADTQTPDSLDCIQWIGFLGPGQGQNVSAAVGLFPSVGDMSVLVNAISNWVSKEGGYESLLSYLYVIFGERTGHTMKVNL